MLLLVFLSLARATLAHVLPDWPALNCINFWRHCHIGVLHCSISSYWYIKMLRMNKPPTYLGVAYCFCSSLCRERRAYHPIVGSADLRGSVGSSLEWICRTLVWRVSMSYGHDDVSQLIQHIHVQRQLAPHTDNHLRNTAKHTITPKDPPTDTHYFIAIPFPTLLMSECNGFCPYVSLLL